MIIIVDYGMGNIRSVLHKISKLGFDVDSSSDPDVIAAAGKLILPGVGSFGSGMNNLSDMDLINALNIKVVREKTPVLGICLGMQLFTRHSEEGEVEGLGWIDGTTKKFSFTEEKLPIPHVGWNTINVKQESQLLSRVSADMRFYFTHSYHLSCDDDLIVATSEYGYEFPSVIQEGNIFGVQFHPEKSHLDGMRIIENFIRI